MKISVWKQLRRHLCHPLQPFLMRFIPLKRELGYLFLLLLIGMFFLSAPVIKETVTVTGTLALLFIPIMLALYYVLLTGLSVTYISILTYLGLLIKKITGRRLNYQQAWVITAGSFTWPFLLSAACYLLIPSLAIYFLVISFLLHITIFSLSILKIPKPKPGQHAATRTSQNRSGS